MADQTQDQTAEDQIEGDDTTLDEEDGAAELPEAELEAAQEHDDDDLRNLSDEERAAYLGEEDDEDAGADEDAAAEGEEPPAAEAPAEAGTEPEAAPEPIQQDQAAIDAKALQDAIEATKQAKADAFQKYEDGELTRDEYLATLGEIDGRAAQVAMEQAQQAREQAQLGQRRDALLTEARAYFSAVPDLASEAHIEAFDAHVRDITGDPRFDRLAPRKVLELAHTRYLAEAQVLGITAPAMPGGAPKAPEAPAKPETPAKKRPDPVPTLAKMPAATITSAADGKYSQLQAAIDAADAETLERILGSMSEAEREAFASMDV